jgi:spore coat protein CotH
LKPDGARPDRAPPDRAAAGGQMGGGFGRTSLKAEEPETLPWLIRFDEFVDGRRYQGHREIAVRVGGMGGGSAGLNEALSLSLLASAGEAVQQYSYAGFTVNDRPTTARLIVEHPDQNFTDQGDDPTNYQDDFDQITMKGSQDLQPVIDLVQWSTTAATPSSTHT